MTRLVVGPFNRVEGDLEVTLDVASGAVRAAFVNSPLYRGFEQILQGKDPADALVFVPRICGICSVAQSRAAAAALAALMGLSMPPNGELATNLVLASENLADHLTHFYLFFMPDFARHGYRLRGWYRDAAARFRAIEGTAAREALPARARFLELMGYLAGKWPHTLGVQPGGSTRPVEASERIRVYSAIREFRGFLERVLFGDALEAIAALDSAAALDAWCEREGAVISDLRRFLRIARDLALERLGRATDMFLSSGAYPHRDGYAFRPGVWDGAAQPHVFLAEDVTEDLSHAWMSGPTASAPYDGTTQPVADKEGAYTWCKAPRWRGRVVETGALARQVVDGHPLIRDLVVRGGGNVTARVVARLLELALVVPRMEQWVLGLTTGEPYCHHGRLPEEGRGVGFVEAARGALGHWIVVSGGRIRNYQIVAPTTWNFSPRDAAGEPGALERALVGLPVGEGDDAPACIQHVVRSFDPCMVCTVH
jgi:uptake hydrogenase large subunit